MALLYDAERLTAGHANLFGNDDTIFDSHLFENEAELNVDPFEAMDFSASSLAFWDEDGDKAGDDDDGADWWDENADFPVGINAAEKRANKNVKGEVQGINAAEFKVTKDNDPVIMGINAAESKTKAHKNAPKFPGVKGWKGRYKNGHIPMDAFKGLIGTNGAHRLRADAAKAYNDMVRAAKKDGIHWGITDSYRDFATQVRLAEEKGLYSQGGLAAVPGTSEHGWGMATDLDLDARALAWLHANADEFGYKTIPREPWHWEYEGGYQPAYQGGAKKQRKDEPKVVVRDRKPKPFRGELPVVPEFDATTVFGLAAAEVLMDDPTGEDLTKRVTTPTSFKHIEHDNLTKQLKKIFEKAAKKTGLDTTFLEVVADHESDFDINADSGFALGVMQINPEYHDLDNFFDPYENIMYGAKYLKGLIDEFGLLEGLARYNGGGTPPASSYAYARSIIRDWKKAR